MITWCTSWFITFLTTAIGPHTVFLLIGTISPTFSHALKTNEQLFLINRSHSPSFSNGKYVMVENSRISLQHKENLIEEYKYSIPDDSEPSRSGKRKFGLFHQLPDDFDSVELSSLSRRKIYKSKRRKDVLPVGSPRGPKLPIRTTGGMGGSPINTTGIAAQKFATQPVPQTAVIGSTVVLPCRVTGKVGRLQWTKNGFGLGNERALSGFSRYSMIGVDDEGDYSLKIQPVLLEDDALYQCQVSARNGIPGIRSRPITLTVYVPPEPPQVRPASVKTMAGNKITLECESLGGRPAPDIQWVDDSKRESIQSEIFFSSDLMPDLKRTVVKSRLTFTPRRFHDNQTVTCVTSNQALSSPLTSSVFLQVLFPPEVSLEPKAPLAVVEGDDAVFHCQATANPSLVTYRWKQNKEVLPRALAKSLRLEKVPRSFHKNTISCEVTNQIGSSKKTTQVFVHYGPVFRSMPRNVMTDQGETVTLKCNVDSNPPPSIVWLKEGSQKIIGSGSALEVRVNSSNAGQYSCIASVKGEDYEFPDLVGKMRILLKGPPLILSASEQRGRLGDTVSLVCNTISVPSPIKVTWTYKGREINLNDPRYEMVEDGDEDHVRNILVIHDSDSQDFGDYNCSVENEYGSARKLITLNPEKNVPVIFVVGVAGIILVVIVLITSIILCNKRHPNKELVAPASARRSLDMSAANAEKYSPPQRGSMSIYDDEDDERSFMNNEASMQISSFPTTNGSSSYSASEKRRLLLDNPRAAMDDQAAQHTNALQDPYSGEINTGIIKPLETTFNRDYMQPRSKSQQNINQDEDDDTRMPYSPQGSRGWDLSPEMTASRISPSINYNRESYPTHSAYKNTHNGHLPTATTGILKNARNYQSSSNASQWTQSYSSPTASNAWNSSPYLTEHRRVSLANGSVGSAFEEKKTPTVHFKEPLRASPTAKYIYSSQSSLYNSSFL